MKIKTIKITPKVINRLNYSNLCKLADVLHVVNPKKVVVEGTLTLDEWGNITHINAHSR